MSVVYRVGLSESDVSEDVLNKSGFKYHKVSPREQMTASARGVLGKPYKRGASVLRDAPNAFDCSSLTAWSAVEAGLAIPRVAIDQFVFSTRVERGDLGPGDLVFSNTGLIIHTEGSYYSQVLNKEVEEVPIRTETLEYLPGTKVPEGVDHVGIYIGDGEVLHATSGRGVIIEKLDTSTGFKNIVGYGRIIKDDSARYVVEIPEDRRELRDLHKLASFLTQNLL